MTVLRAFGIVVASAIGFGAAGAGIGYWLGVAVPEYYRGVFRAGRDAQFNPVAVGLGLGLSQGLLGGLLVGAAIVVAVAWYNSRVRSAAENRRD